MDKSPIDCKLGARMLKSVTFSCPWPNLTEQNRSREYLSSNKMSTVILINSVMTKNILRDRGEGSSHVQVRIQVVWEAQIGLITYNNNNNNNKTPTQSGQYQRLPGAPWGYGRSSGAWPGHHFDEGAPNTDGRQYLVVWGIRTQNVVTVHQQIEYGFRSYTVHHSGGNRPSSLSMVNDFQVYIFVHIIWYIMWLPIGKT